MIECKLLEELAELATRVCAQQAKQQVFGTNKLIPQLDFLCISLRNRLLKRRRDINLTGIEAARDLRQLVDLTFRSELYRSRRNLQSLQ